jgi:hypothetical protein
MVKQHILPAPGLPIKKSAARNFGIEHFLKTHGLSTKLNFVEVVFFRLAALIFQRKRLPPCPLGLRILWRGVAGIVEIKMIQPVGLLITT